MSLVTKGTILSLDVASARYAVRVSHLFAAEDLAAVAPCYINAAGRVAMSIDSQETVTNVSDFVGFTADAVPSGQPVTLFGKGARFSYGSSLTPNTPLYVAATAGRLDTGQISSADDPTALVISTKDILVLR